jgi:cytochrome d ubiquinol oxidase subunit II
LPSIANPAMDLTIDRARTGAYALQVGSIWWGFGMLLALGYFVVAYRMFRGKVDIHSGGYGH